MFIIIDTFEGSFPISLIHTLSHPILKAKPNDIVNIKIALHTRNDIVNIKISATRIKSYYMIKVLNKT
jgi:hypothetical protein